MCITQTQSIAGHGRRARIDATVNAIATEGGALLYLDPVFSFDGGATWELTRQYDHVMVAAPGSFVATGSVISNEIDLFVGDNAVFGLFVRRSSTSTVNLLGAQCLVRATINTLP